LVGASLSLAGLRLGSQLKPAGTIGAGYKALGLFQVQSARPEIDDPVVAIENLGAEQTNRRRR